MLKPIFINLFILISIFSVAQTAENIDSIGNWDDNELRTISGLNFNDIWGYIDEDFKEYGIIGSVDYTHFIDLNDPTNLIEIDRIAGRSASIWRDFKTYLHYGYGVADNGGASLQIFDLSDLPNSVTKVFDSQVFFTYCHNIFIDELNGRLYAVGTGSANIVVLDIKTEPANPTLLKNINLNDGYIHDIYVKNNIAYASHIYKSKLTVYNLTDLDNILNLGFISDYLGAGLNHSSWLSDNGNVLAMADENHGLSVKLVDVSNLPNLSILGSFKSTLESPVASNSIAHNPFVIGNNYVVVSYYHDGVQIYDISDPENPQRAGYFDTFENNDYGGYEGSWGVYPFFPSGRIIASDIVGGLFIMQPTFDLGYCRKEIFTAHQVESGNTSEVYASNAVYLRNGFHAKSGSTFRAHTQSCVVPANVINSIKNNTFGKTPSKETDLLVNSLILNGFEEINMEVYPNPFISEFSIITTGLENVNIKDLFLVNSLGQMLSTRISECGNNCFTLKGANLKSGIYIIGLKKDSEILLLEKVIKY